MRKFILVALLVMACFSQAQARSVAIIVSMVNDSVQALQDSFISTLSDKGLAVQSTVYSLKEKDAQTIAGLIAAQKPDMALGVGSEAANLVRSGLGSVPGEYVFVPKNSDFDSANMTGVSLDIPAALRIERIKTVLPSVKRVGVLYSPASEASFTELSAACSAAGLSAVGRMISSDAEFTPAVQALMGGQADCVVMIMDTRIYFGQTVKTLLLESVKNKIPVIGLSLIFTKAGALMSVDCDYRDLGRQAGEIGAHILNGEKPGDIKSQRPRKAKYSLNMIVANQFGMQFSGSAASEATEVVK